MPFFSLPQGTSLGSLGQLKGKKSTHLLAGREPSFKFFQEIGQAYCVKSKYSQFTIVLSFTHSWGLSILHILFWLLMRMGDNGGVAEYDTFEEFLDSQVAPIDLFYLEVCM